MRSTLLQLLPSVTFVFAMRSLTPTSSEQYEDFVEKVVFRVADGVWTLTMASLTLKTEDLSGSNKTRCTVACNICMSLIKPATKIEHENLQ